MICWRSDPNDPTDVCNATAADLLAFVAQQYPTAWLVLKVLVVASLVLSAGIAAGAALVAWRQRMVARLEHREAAAVAAAARARTRGRRAPTYPVRCTAETVRLRRVDGRLEVDEPRGP
ncbi:hypothetical protein [Micromonospora sp. NPDC005652]|uniref:hypothetical protein n=1 Tax=Micromonospora sp. NPDC005652 TaxID=3157046 RepID=UPI0033E8F91E